MSGVSEIDRMLKDIYSNPLPPPTEVQHLGLLPISGWARFKNWCGDVFYGIVDFIIDTADRVLDWVLALEIAEWLEDLGD